LEIARIRTVVLAGGRSERMGFDKLTAPFAGEPLARRVARALLELEPLFVATPRVADVVSDLRDVHVVVTPPTAGPSETLALAHAAVQDEAYLAVTACDLPFLDAALVRSFVARVEGDPDLAWPVVRGTPGHPVLWSPSARARIPGLQPDEPPIIVRRDPALRTSPIAEENDAYVTDVDTPDRWAEAELRATRALR
jgi:molybdenum cofactor cytidylyltransferase